MSIESVLANRSLIRGFLCPIYYDEYGRQDQPTALTHDDFCKVRDGYACSRCLCEYTTYLVTCPACGYTRDVARDLAPPQADHVAHLSGLAATEGMDVGTPKTFDEFMRELEKDKNVDHVPLEKLMPSKRGRK